MLLYIEADSVDREEWVQCYCISLHIDNAFVYYKILRIVLSAIIFFPPLSFECFILLQIVRAAGSRTSLFGSVLKFQQ